MKKKLRDEWKKKGISNPDIDHYINDFFDSNVITPGTEFMDTLSKIL